MTRVSVMLFLLGYSTALLTSATIPVGAVDGDFDQELPTPVPTASLEDEQLDAMRDDVMRRMEMLLARARFYDKLIREDIARRSEVKKAVSKAPPAKRASAERDEHVIFYLPAPTPTPESAGGLLGPWLNRKSQ